MKVMQTWYPFFFERLLRIADSMQCTLYGLLVKRSTTKPYQVRCTKLSFKSFAIEVRDRIIRAPP